MIDSYYDSNKIMIQQIAIQKLECERLEKKIEEHIQQKISDTGKQANLPKIDKLHKELLFAEWRPQINEAEKEATKTSKKSNEIIQSICDQMFKIELLKENTSDMFSGTKEVELKWRQRADTQEEMIKKINNFDQENYWNFFIKPYHQHQTLQSLTDSAKRSQSIIANAIFKGQIRSQISQPAQLKVMFDIYQLHDHIQK